MTGMGMSIPANLIIIAVTCLISWIGFKDRAFLDRWLLNPYQARRKNTVLPNVLVTPTTKGNDGAHDVPLTVAEVAQRGLVEHRRWGEVVEAAILLFQRGQQKAAEAGLILADTKYEFGTAADGSLLLIDEMHTPDSSRYWVADSYDARLAVGEEPESLDKEVVRRALLTAGYRGEGEPPVLSAEVWTETTRRYITAFERLTGTTFEPGAYPVPPRIMEHLRHVPESP